MGEPRQRLLICGTRTLAADMADMASEVPGVEVVGFVENWDRARCEQPYEGLPVYWVDDLPRLARDHVAVCALATTHRSRFTRQVEAHGMGFATLVHPMARVSTRSSLGPGTIVAPGAVIGAHTHVGRHVIVSRGALIGHHTRIGDHASIMPGANIAGNSRFGDAVFVAIGATVLDNLTVGAHSVIGAGAVVVKDVPDRTLVVGLPARVVKENIDGR